MSPGIFRRSKRDGVRLRLEQSLGAFPVGNGDISPLYVLFGVSNVGSVAAVAETVYLRAGRDTVLDLSSELGGDGVSDEKNGGGPPRGIPPGESATLWLWARDLAGKLRDAGHAATPKLRLLVVDSEGGEHATTFKFRVDEYLQLKDE
jgi:hypothetical protein